MKISKVVSRFCSLLFIVITSGCAQYAQSAPTPSPVSPTIPIMMTIAEKTATPMLRPSATNTSIPPATPTDVQPLSAEDALQRLLALLANNSNCRLPCLWDITPGESRNMQAREILMPLSGISDISYFKPDRVRGVLLGEISPIYKENYMQFNTRVIYLYGVDGIVSSISFQAFEERVDKKDEYGNQIKIPIFDSPMFLKRVEYYSLSHVLSEQGMPDTVMIQTSGLSVGGGMNIALLYPDQGIWVNYTTKIIYNNGVVKRGCPANAHIDMELFPAGDSASFFLLLDKTDWGVTKSGYMPLEKATSLSVKEFYQTFQNSTDKCIETPAKLWPTPESGGR